MFTAARRVAAAGVVLTALAAGACTGDEAPSDGKTNGAIAAPAPATRDRAESESYAGATQTTTGAKGWKLLEIPDIGSITVSCPAGTPRTAFTVVANGASTVVVVSTSGEPAIGGLVDPGETFAARTRPRAVMYQTWHLTPVRPGDIRVARVNVASIPAPAALGGGEACHASAEATVSTGSG